LNTGEEIELSETFVGALMGPAGFEAELVAGLKPISDLLDGCLFEIGREKVLAWAWSVAGENVAATVLP
jgi:hypothetical protein